MSWKASAYVKALIVCPSGERISRTEKLVALVLADSHQEKGEGTFPAMRTIAEDALMDERVCRRLLASLERKGVIVRRRVERQGRGQTTFYLFPALDKKQESEGGHGVPLSRADFLAKRRTEGGPKGDKPRAPSIEEQELEQEPKTPQPHSQANGETAVISFPTTSSTSVEDAVERVMRGCVFTARRLRRKLHAVVMQRVSEGDSPEDVAKKMIDAWKRYGNQGTRLYRHCTAAEFFEGGLWANSNLWGWDNNEIREARTDARANVGRNWG